MSPVLVMVADHMLTAVHLAKSLATGLDDAIFLHLAPQQRAPVSTVLLTCSQTFLCHLAKRSTSAKGAITFGCLPFFNPFQSCCHCS